MLSEDDFHAVPRLARVPDAQREFRDEVVDGLFELTRYVRKLQAALSLFDFALSQNLSLPALPPYDPRRGTDRLSEIKAWQSSMRDQPFCQWQLIAVHAGIFCIDHFLQTMKYIRTSLAQAPALFNRTNQAQLDKAQQIAGERFPDIPDLRNAIAHLAELSKNMRAIRTNSFKGPLEDGYFQVAASSAVMVSDYLNGRTFNTSRNGKLLSFEFSEKSASDTIGIRNEFYAAFN